MSACEQPLGTTATDAGFTWRVHPARERPLAACGAAATIGLFVAVCAISFGAGWGLLAAACLIGSLRRFFFSSEYVLSSSGITSRSALGSKYQAWSDVRRFVHDDRGAFLSTRARPSILDTWRGMHIMFGTRREAALGRIRNAWRPAEVSPSGEEVASACPG